MGNYCKSGKPVKSDNYNSKKYQGLSSLFFVLVLFTLSLSVVYAQGEDNVLVNDLSDNPENLIATDTPYDVPIHVFYGEGCPHCARMLSFLDSIKGDYPTLRVYSHEVYHDSEGRMLFQEISAAMGREISGVPTTFIGEEMIFGYSNVLGESIKEKIEACLKVECVDPIPHTQIVPSNQTNNSDNNRLSEELDSNNEGNKAADLSNKLTIPIVVSAAAVDAINPCAFAVLIILMTAALSIADKKRALRFGLAFTVSIYISYFLMGLGLFSILQAAGLSHNFYIFVTALAVVVGLLNIKDYFWYGKGFLMEVPMSWRPAMKKILRGATSPFGAFLVGFVVSLFELPCTGGPYIVILGLLANEVSRNTAILYLLLYNLVFISPLIVLSVIIYKGISTTEKLESIRQDKIKLLHLISGILMLGIAAVMILSIIKGWV